MAKRYRLGCDIGGTFTDFVLLDEATGEMRVEKCLTTPADPSTGVMNGVGLLDERVPGFLAETLQVLHGTTLVINAVLERKGAKTALITTEGFRDVLEIASERRYDLYDLQQQYPAPLVPRYLRRGLEERLRSDGLVLTPLDTDGLDAIAADFASESVEAVAVCLLHSYRSPAHEQAVEKRLGELLPGISVSISSDVLPEINEYARTSTTVVNAYTKPLMARYLASLEDRLAVAELEGQLLIMLSSGGVASVETASRYPVRVIESGPVGGVIVSQHIKNLAGIDAAFSFDMGGTTAKLCLLEGDEPHRATEYEVARVHRFKAGSGIPIKVPCVDLLEIGAGGGSIAEINPLGLLQVGPESAGAAPGPACYGQGGERPTVTDADLVLGFLNEDYFLGGTMDLDRQASRDAIGHRVAEPLGLDIERAAWGIHDSVNESMASATKMYAAERGVDCASLALVASGGAGPVHCYGLARKLGIREIVVPPAVGVASAIGFLAAPVSYDLVRTHKTPLASADLAEIDARFEAMRREAVDTLARAGEPAVAAVERSFDIRYVGQGYEINVAVGTDAVAAVGRERLLDRFKETYEALFGRAFPENEFEIVNLRLIARGPRPESPLRPREAVGGTALKGSRPAYCPQAQAFVAHAVYDRYALAPGATFAGPAIVEERESTSIVGTGARARVDDLGLLRIQMSEA
ncbi:MAG: hydantoinase/oxoprolinase family protein [Alphaproteobacteria bacterium]|nr:hydantoinase/oxoprolinase family protein [Alphaproteobacteria bacterium]